MLDDESLTFALKTFSKGTPAEGMKLETEHSDPSFKCEKCGTNGE